MTDKAPKQRIPSRKEVEERQESELVESELTPGMLSYKPDETGNFGTRPGRNARRT